MTDEAKLREYATLIQGTGTLGIAALFVTLSTHMDKLHERLEKLEQQIKTSLPT